MTRPARLIVTDASPLITLAAADALHCLTMPGIPIVIPDMVYFEVTRDLAKTGATEVADWYGQQSALISIAPTRIYAEYLTLLHSNPHVRSRGRGEQAAIETLDTLISADPLLTAILFFEDNDLSSRRTVRLLPDRVTAFSTGDLLHELEQAGRIQSAEHILDAAAAKDRNVSAQRSPQASDEDRAPLRDIVQRRSGGA